MKALKELSVIECKYCYNCWKVNPHTVPYTVTDPLREFTQPRSADLYRLCGVYHKAGVPFAIREIDAEHYPGRSPYLSVPKDFSDAVCDGIRSGRGVLIADGYCAYAPAIAGGIQRAIGTDKKIGLIWIDAHADNRIIEDPAEPETRFVGFPVSAAVGQTYESWRVEGCGLVKPLDGRHVLASDGRANIESFDRNLKAAGSTQIDAAGFDDPTVWKEAVERLAAEVEAIYLSVDVDILAPEYIPAYAKVVPGGHTVETVMSNIRTVMDTGKVLAYSVFCVDFDLYEQNGEWTYLNGMKLIAAGLESWKMLPL